MREIIFDIVDDAHFLETSKDYAKNVIVGFASIGGIKVGIVANQPAVLAGVLDIDSSVKAADLFVSVMLLMCQLSRWLMFQASFRNSSGVRRYY